MNKTQYMENIRMALETLRRHKMRSLLTVVGVIVGVMTVIVISSILTGVRHSMVGLIQEYGTDNIYAFHLRTGFQGIPSRDEFFRQPLTVEDARSLKRRGDAIKDVAYQGFALFQQQSVRSGKEGFNRAQVMGISPNHAELVNASIAEGRFLNDADNLRSAMICVLGSNIVEALFPHEKNVLGREVQVNGNRLIVVGLLEKRQNSLFGETDDDNSLFMPYRTMRRLNPENKNLLLLIQAYPGRLAEAWDQTEAILRARRGVRFDEENDFDLNTADRMISQFDALTATFGLVAIAISAVGLLVGGIGVMNIMLVSVTERTKEIGLRKALGAKQMDIVQQFLFEAITLTAVGGMLGILIAVLLSQLVVLLVPAIPATVPSWAVIAGFLVSVSVGLIFGVGPAIKASRLDPIESLRYE